MWPTRQLTKEAQQAGEERPARVNDAVQQEAIEGFAAVLELGDGAESTAREEAWSQASCTSEAGQGEAGPPTAALTHVELGQPF